MRLSISTLYLSSVLSFKKSIETCELDICENKFHVVFLIHINKYIIKKGKFTSLSNKQSSELTSFNSHRTLQNGKGMVVNNIDMALVKLTA